MAIRLHPWQTLKKHLNAQPTDDVAGLQQALDAFRDYYNQIRPHRGIGRAHNRTEIICLIHNNDTTVITNGELLAEFTLDPTKGYQRKNG